MVHMRRTAPEGELATERLVLRELLETDLDGVSEMLGDPQVLRHYPAPLARTASSRGARLTPPAGSRTWPGAGR
jgi:RimJ/RimL family protein N-acetyltransferase